MGELAGTAAAAATGEEEGQCCLFVLGLCGSQLGSFLTKVSANQLRDSYWLGGRVLGPIGSLLEVSWQSFTVGEGGMKVGDQEGAKTTM